MSALPSQCFARALSAVLAVAVTAEAADDRPAGWPGFLGPQRNGRSADTGLNTDWNAHPPKVLWKVPLGGGYSSAAFGDGRLFTMVNRGARDFVVCLDSATGKEVWSLDAAPRYLDGQKHGPGPRATPTVQGDRVWCLLAGGELYCLKAADGAVVWKTHILEATAAGDHGDLTYYWGMAGSPLIDGDRVIVQPGGDKNNSVAAFHKDTGKLLWSAGSDRPGYGSPIIVTAAGRRQVVCTTARSILSLDPADGKVLWRYEFGRELNCNCATPIWVDDVLLVSSAYGVGSAALQIAAEGGGLTIREKWRTKDLQNQFATSMVHDGHVYGCHGDLGVSMLRCVELATGKLKWSDRTPAKCSLLLAAGHLICLSEKGTLRLIAADPAGYSVKGELPNLLTPRCWAAPALLDGRLYLRDEKHMICLDLRKP